MYTNAAMTTKAEITPTTALGLLLVTFCVAQLQVEATEITLLEISKSVIKSLTNCDEKNVTLSVCLKKRSVILLDKYSRAPDPISLMSDSLSLVKSEVSVNSTESNRSMGDSGLTPEKLDEYLPAEESSRQRVLDALLVGSVSKFLQSRSLQVKLPQFLARYISSGLDEGRGKKAEKYYGAFILGAMLVAGTLIPIKMGTLALMSGKALMTSMLALTLAGIVAVKKLSEQPPKPGTTTYEVINVPAGGGSHGHHGRSLPLSTIPPEILESAHLPKVVSPHSDTGPYSAYKSYVYNDSVNMESDYVS